MYSLNSLYQTRDITGQNPNGVKVGIRSAIGPWKRVGGAFEFKGSRNSYIEFPNHGKLDTKRSMTLCAWIYPVGKPGPIFNYKKNGWGVHFWVTGKRQLFVRFVRRSGAFTPYLARNVLYPGRWNFVCASYNYKSGIAKLWKNSRTVQSKHLGRFKLATNYSARMGARIGDRRYFAGRISCMQVYSTALNNYQILKAKRLCYKKPTVKPTKRT